MKLIASITLETQKGDKQITNALDLGAAPEPQVVQHALHQLLGQMANMLGLHQGSRFRALAVNAEADAPG
jgi:hypothetical protein